MAVVFYESCEDYKERITQLYERAILAAGLEFKSDKLWEHYINWASKFLDIKQVTRIYDRLLSTPTLMYYQHWENFKRLIEDYELMEILEPDDLQVMKNQFLECKRTEELETRRVTMAAVQAAVKCGSTNSLPIHSISSSIVVKGGGESQNVENGGNTEGNDREDSIVSNDIKNGEELTLSQELAESSNDVLLVWDDSYYVNIKEIYTHQKETQYQANYEEISKRWYFEEKIKRPYFHVKPLEPGQIKNWQEYLTFERDVVTHNHTRVIILYERCLIACALYEEFWIQYAQYLELQVGDIEASRNAYSRACYVHLPHKSTVHWYWSMFEEKHGDSIKAISILADREIKFPHQVLLRSRKLGCLRRHCHDNNNNNDDAVITSYEAALSEFSDECDTRIWLYFVKKYARYLAKVKGDKTAAVELLKKSILNRPIMTELYDTLFDIYYSSSTSVDITGIDDTLKLICDVNNNEVKDNNKEHLSDEVKLQLMCKGVELLEDYCDQFSLLQHWYEEITKISNTYCTNGTMSTNSTDERNAPRGQVDITISKPSCSKKPRLDNTSKKAPANSNDSPSYIYDPFIAVATSSSLLSKQQKSGQHSSSSAALHTPCVASPPLGFSVYPTMPAYNNSTPGTSMDASSTAAAAAAAWSAAYYQSYYGYAPAGNSSTNVSNSDFNAPWLLQRSNY